MPGRGSVRSKKNNPSKKRDKRLGAIKYDEKGNMIDDRNTEAGQALGYKDIVKDNALFVAYYKQLGLCKSEEEFQEMIDVLKKDLPASFRITGNRSQAKSLLRTIESQCFSELSRSGGETAVPKVLPWYPDNLAYQLNVTRKDIRRMEEYWQLHNFLISETESGAISRQETVSMIPPIVLGVEPHHKVLDMCAAPGSKTAQLIEALHQTSSPDKLPTGFVVANDKDNSRCYMLTHQAKRLQSPCVIIINHDATCLPNLLVPKEDNRLTPVKYDRILADVPCTGDGTMRKNPDIWPKWNPVNGTNLHSVQYRIAKRGLELLAVGGRLVYSTCSLNPVENEAVVARILLESGSSVRLIDPRSQLPGLICSPGLTSWNVGSKSGELYNKWEEVPEKLAATQIRPQMFPQGEEGKLGIEKCVRVLPHKQNTGGFFVALLEKVALCPWESQPRVVDSSSEKPHGQESNSEPEPPPKRRFWGFKEDPFIYFEKDEAVFPKIQNYFSLQLPYLGFLTRSAEATKKNNIYLTTTEVREVIETNKDRVKIINTGVKAFARVENKGADCDYRIAQEGALSTIPFIKGRRVHPGHDDLVLLLQTDDTEKPPEIERMSLKFQTELASVDTGSVAYIYKDPETDLSVDVVGWKGKISVRAYVPRNDRRHYLHLLGADLGKFDQNKFKGKKDNVGTEDTKTPSSNEEIDNLNCDQDAS